MLTHNFSTTNHPTLFYAAQSQTFTKSKHFILQQIKCPATVRPTDHHITPYKKAARPHRAASHSFTSILSKFNRPTYYPCFPDGLQSIFVSFSYRIFSTKQFQKTAAKISITFHPYPNTSPGIRPPELFSASEHLSPSKKCKIITPKEGLSFGVRED